MHSALWAAILRQCPLGILVDGSAPVVQQFLQDVGGSHQLGQLGPSQGRKMGGEILNAAFALPVLKKPRTLGGRANTHAPSIIGISSNFDHAAAFQAGDDSTDGGCLDLLRGGKIAKRFRSGEDQDRQSRKLRWPYTGNYVLQASAAQQVNCRGMKAVGSFQNFMPWVRFSTSALTFGMEDS